MTAATDRAKGPQRRQILGLDGLRAIAAVAVIIYHVFPGSLTGGFLGVDVFFVLSGFLITSLLIVERESTGQIRLGMFWIRRLRRLMPALIVCVAGTVPFALLAGEDAYVALRRQLVGIFTYTYNWIEIASGASYFDERIPLLYTNVWSLAVEEQFYLVWPLVVLLLLRRPGARWLTPAYLAVASVVAMLALWVPGVNPNRVYLGTDTHAFGLMIGAMLAFVVPTALSGGLPPSPVWLRRLRQLVGWLGLASMLCAMWVITGAEEWLFPWGLLWTSVSSLAVVQSLMPNVAAQPMVWVLNLRGFRWVGERSYGLYLWHWPVWVILVNLFPLAEPLVTGVAAFVVTVVAAAASFKYVETPIRRLGWRESYRRLRSWTRGRFPGDVHRFASVFGTSLLALVLVGFGAVSSPDTNSVQRAFEAQETAPVSEPELGPESAPSSVPAQPAVTGKMITVIGDSVTKMAEPALAKLYPGIRMDSKVSRSTRVAAAMLRELKDKGQLREYVVIGLATNGKILDSEVEEMLKILGKTRKLVLITGYGPKREPWIWESNDTILRWGKKHPDRIAVADWAKAIKGHEDKLYADQTHPKDGGARLYAKTVKLAIEG